MQVQAIHPVQPPRPATAQDQPAPATEAPGQQGATDDAAQISAAAREQQSSELHAELSQEEQRRVQELKARDREVRAHEQAHMAAAGGLAKGGPRYSYQQGPDGHRYAVGGEVQIDTSEGRSPKESLQKGQRIVAAALAPQEPSGQDRQVAATGRKMITEARAAQAAERREDKPADPAAHANGPAPTSPEEVKPRAGDSDIDFRLRQLGLEP